MKSNRRVTENNLYNKLVYMIDRTGNGRYSKIITYLELQRKGSRGEKWSLMPWRDTARRRICEHVELVYEMSLSKRHLGILIYNMAAVRFCNHLKNANIKLNRFMMKKHATLPLPRFFSKRISENYIFRKFNKYKKNPLIYAWRIYSESFFLLLFAIMS